METNTVKENATQKVDLDTLRAYERIVHFIYDFRGELLMEAGYRFDDRDTLRIDDETFYTDDRGELAAYLIDNRDAAFCKALVEFAEYALNPDNVPGDEVNCASVLRHLEQYRTLRMETLGVCVGCKRDMELAAISVPRHLSDDIALLFAERKILAQLINAHRPTRG